MIQWNLSIVDTLGPCKTERCEPQDTRTQGSVMGGGGGDMKVCHLEVCHFIFQH